MELLREAKTLGFRMIWIQPGAEDASVIQSIKESQLVGSVICDAPAIPCLCVLANLPTALTTSIIATGPGCGPDFI